MRWQVSPAITLQRAITREGPDTLPRGQARETKRCARRGMTNDGGEDWRSSSRPVEWDQIAFARQAASVSFVRSFLPDDPISPDRHRASNERQ